jgi:hypothetical protein
MGKPASMDVHAEGLNLAGQTDLLVNPHGKPGCLFTVSERRVEHDQPVFGVRHGRNSVPGGPCQKSKL